MKFVTRLLAALASLACLCTAQAATEAGPRQPRVATAPTEARVIVKYRAGSTLRQAQSAASGVSRPQHAAVMAKRLGLTLKDRWVLGANVQSMSGEGVSAQDLARQLAAQPEVEWAVPVERKVAQATVPNDPLYPNGLTTTTPVVGQWYLRAPDSTFTSAINAVGGWAVTTGSASITVAVLDTGVRFDHPDFAPSAGGSKLYAGYDFISHTDASGDGTGRDADATDPGDWTTASDGCSASESSWHGTQTASLIGAATDNGVGMASVGRDVMVLPVRVLGKCGGYDDDIQAAMLWAAGLSSSPVANAHPAQIINMSLGSSGTCNSAYQQVFDQLTAANVAVVVSAGNDEGLAVETPANCNGAIAVGGLRNVGTKVGYSSLGPEVTISAPAGNCINTSGACLYPIITATNAGLTTAAGSTYTNSSNYAVGTSFSAPLVAGAIALMRSVDPTLSVASIKSVLQSTARAFPTAGGTSGTAQCAAPSSVAQDECYCTTSTCGAGMLDVAGAVRLPPVLSFSASSTALTVGGSATLTATAQALAGRSIASYQWAITSGAGLASFSGSTTDATAVLNVTGAGTVVVGVTVTDSAGNASAQSTTVTIAQAPVASSDSGGGGGGGAVSPAALALLALAALAGRTVRRRTRA